MKQQLPSSSKSLGVVTRLDAGKTDGPLASLVGARDAIRRLKGEHGGKLPGPVRVLVQGGLYEMAEPLRLAPEDSGTEEDPITFAAHPRAEGSNPPTLSGGVMLGGWKVDDDSVGVGQGEYRRLDRGRHIGHEANPLVVAHDAGIQHIRHAAGLSRVGQPERQERQ